jgi:hypothetical protein
VRRAAVFKVRHHRNGAPHCISARASHEIAP